MAGILATLNFPERVLAFAFAVSGALLAGAHMFESFGGLVPCALCLDQREAHWAALAVAAAGLFVSIIFKSRLGAAAAVGAASLVYAVSAGLAFYHTGVEYDFWPGPAICSGAGADAIDLGSISGALDSPVKAPSCEDAQWRQFGVSMAGYNLLISAGLFALTFTAALGATRAARKDRQDAPV